MTPMPGVLVPGPHCCGRPMRQTGMGAVGTLAAWLCPKCERYQGPRGARTPEEWWLVGEDGRSAWKDALGEAAVVPVAIDPLDAVIGGNMLRELLVCDEIQRRGECTPHFWFSPAQRAAVNAHWSAELRAKVAASAERDRNEVRCDLQDGP